LTVLESLNPSGNEGQRDPARADRSPLRVVVRRAPVVDASETLVRVETRFPSDVTAIEEAVELIVRHCLSGTLTPQRLRFNLCVALSESLANAIVCGNQEDLSKWVEVRAELRTDTIVVQVTDEGDGFDPATVKDPTGPDDLEEPCGRGLFLIRSLVDEVRFNPKGNSICLTLRRK
jgi:serine/threonine-protein kinase RsbW